MKKVIFICLLSISMCLSESSPQEQASKPATNPPVQTQASEKPQTGQATVPSQADNSTGHEAAANGNTSENAAPTTITPTVKPESTDSKNQTDKKPTTLKPEPTISTSTEKASVTTTSPTPTTPNTTSSTVKPDDKGKDTSTVPSVISTPAPATKSPPTLQARAFDGPSFIGGIILTLGLLAVGFMGFKYYKKQHGDNYHTL